MLESESVEIEKKARHKNPAESGVKEEERV